VSTAAQRKLGALLETGHQPCDMVAIAKITSAVASQAHFGLMAGMGYGGIWRGYGGHTLYQSIT